MLWKSTARHCACAILNDSPVDWDRCLVTGVWLTSLKRLYKSPAHINIFSWKRIFFDAHSKTLRFRNHFQKPPFSVKMITLFIVLVCGRKARTHGKRYFSNEYALLWTCSISPSLALFQYFDPCKRSTKVLDSSSGFQPYGFRIATFWIPGSIPKWIPDPSL